MNALALGIIGVLSALPGRGIDLCRIILFYYLAYYALTPIAGLGASSYYLAQLTLDAAIVFLCCRLAVHSDDALWPLLYAGFVFSSLVCDGLKYIDEVSGLYVMSGLHEWRQSFSIPVDLFFAVVGCNGLRDILSSGWRAFRANISRNRTNSKA